MADRSDLIREVLSLRENAAMLKLFVQELQSHAGVIPFVRAGFSKPIGYPLWTRVSQRAGWLCWRPGIDRGTDSEMASMEEAAEDLLSPVGPDVLKIPSFINSVTSDLTTTAWWDP